MDAAGLRTRAAADVAAALDSVRSATDGDGLVAFFPRVPGAVWLTASAYRVMLAAGRAGLPVDKAEADRFAAVLKMSLRSDYPHLISREELFERVSALLALADAGQLPAEDADELARRTAVLRTGPVAEVATALALGPASGQLLLGQVLNTMWSRVNLLSRDGKPVYGGLVDHTATPQILPSETRSLAEVVQAAATATPSDPRLPVLRTGLLTLADGEGWGSTNATGAALMALAASWQTPSTPVNASVTLPDRPETGVLDHEHPLLKAATRALGPVAVQAVPGIAVLAATDYVPMQPGSEAKASQNGLIVVRTLYRVPPAAGGMQPPLIRLMPAADGAIHLKVGDVVEEADELTTDAERSQVALHLPIAAGLEPLNPALANATAEATPSAGPSVPPDWSGSGDDEVLAVWLQFERGTATLRNRQRASIPGSFTEPPATAELLYQRGVFGSSDGARVVVEP